METKQDEQKEEQGVQFQAKKNCKTCHGRGYIIRTFPIGTVKSGRKKDDVKESHGMKTLCHCATEILKEEPEPVLKVNTPSPDESFVPKVAGNVLDKVNDIADEAMKAHILAIPPEGSEVLNNAVNLVKSGSKEKKQYASRAVPS